MSGMHDYYFGARFTDATVFALWYIIVWSVQSITLSLHSRFELVSACFGVRILHTEHDILYGLGL